MKDIYLSVALIVQNEEQYIKQCLQNIKDIADEIVIIDGGSIDETVNICKKYTDKIYTHKFNDDFSQQRNYANYYSKGKWILQIDADETLSENLKKNLLMILRHNEDKDLIYVPRKNIVFGLKNEDIKNWNWNVDKEGWINFPDYQSRIYKNSGFIKWVGNVHETITGHKNYSKIPAEKENGLYIEHIKDIERQRKQNNKYKGM